MSSTTYMLRVRFTEEQHKYLLKMCEADGDKTLSSWVRRKLFENLSTEIKLNSILNLLQENKKQK